MSLYALVQPWHFALLDDCLHVCYMCMQMIFHYGAMYVSMHILGFNICIVFLVQTRFRLNALFRNLSYTTESPKIVCVTEAGLHILCIYYLEQCSTLKPTDSDMKAIPSGTKSIIKCKTIKNLPAVVEKFKVKLSPSQGKLD